MIRLNIAISICLILFASCNDNPEFIAFAYPGGKHKALVLSYDDGTIQDIELAQLFDKHNLVGTFNLNSGFLGVTRGWPLPDGDTVYQEYISKDTLLSVYKNHEIAAHGELHKNFTDISAAEVLQEVNADLEVLRNATNREIISLAYPFGNTSEEVAKVVSSTGIINGRTVADTYTFALPEDYMIWDPTCHDSKVLDHLDEFLDLKSETLSLFYVWGHSWEFGDQQRWDNMVEFCEKIGDSEDVWSVGNGELTQYLQAIESVELKSNSISNPANNNVVWVRLSSGVEELEAGETLHIKTPVETGNK